MKYFPLFLLIAIFSSCCNEESLVLPNPLRIEKDEDIEKYCELLKETEVFDGDILINPSSSGDLSYSSVNCLSEIKEITGILEILGTDFEDYDYLSSLESCGAIFIEGNDIVDTIFFPMLRSVNGTFNIYNHKNLLSVVTPKIESIGSHVIFEGNVVLNSWHGSEAMVTMPSLSIVDSENFEALVDFPNITLFENDVYILFSNVNNQNFCHNQFSVMGELKIISEGKDPDFSFLENLITAGSVVVAGNIDLDDLCSLQGYATSHNNILCILWNEGFYYANDILDNCE
ncbi:MAG: hypothetical protein KDC16_02315 [Saprospiraceae bacterium]|nr:hypothetical protein [Saprospiraceae bacterium]